MRIGITSILIMLLASPAISQELDLNFDDDFTFDDDLSFELPDEEPSSGFEISSTVGLSYSGVGDLTSGAAAQINIANQHDLGSYGYLEWAANVQFADITNSVDATFNLSRIHLQNSAGDLSWKLGKYRIGWGEVEAAPVLDVVNAGLSFGDVGLSSDELPGQWFAGVDYFSSAATFSGFVGVAPEVTHILPAADTPDIEVGLKTSMQITDGAVNVYVAQLVPQSGVADIGAGISSAEPYALAGISANRSFGNVLVELDLAGKFGLQRSTMTDMSTHNRVDAALGVEVAASNTMQISAAIIGQHWLEQTEDYYELGGYASGQTTGSYILGVSDSFAAGKLSVSANLLGSLDDTLGITSLSATYNYSDAVNFGASATWLGAASGTPFETMDGFTQYGITSTIYF